MGEVIELDAENRRLRKVLENVKWMLAGARTDEMLDKMSAYVDRALGSVSTPTPTGDEE